MSSACPTRQRLAHLLEGEIPDAEQRALTAHLDQCRQCQGVFDELLAQHPGPIDPEIADLATATTPEPAGQPRSGDVLAAESPLIGQRVGQYHIKNLIATGGMGSVYLAVQEQPRRTVALKLLKRGIASRSALRRFEYEAQILARLRHPGIAQIYEAGTHQEDPAGPGTPFFAMEYIAEAKSITQYAADRKLGTHKRLELFARICDAVHHGHQKGIIHRDLKPTNLLVDAAGQVKVIDFGVARATDSDQAVTTLQTDLGQLIGTLQYMSPEQYDADPAALDTRSDVYALGVVLYELLCERLPYDLTRATIYQAARIIRDQAPPRPSTVSRLITADLETITLKALQKQRDERYQSAGDLGRDVRRYLNHEPIDARPLSFTYQIGKLAQPALVVSVSTDALYPPEEQQELARYLPNARY